jgi:hypothetical protein
VSIPVLPPNHSIHTNRRHVLKFRVRSVRRALDSLSALGAGLTGIMPEAFKYFSSNSQVEDADRVTWPCLEWTG